MPRCKMLTKDLKCDGICRTVAECPAKKIDGKKETVEYATRKDET